jgi:hypothetical protein
VTAVAAVDPVAAVTAVAAVNADAATAACSATAATAATVKERTFLNHMKCVKGAYIILFMKFRIPR